MPSRKSIPKPLKQQVWDKYIGKKKGVAKCTCCNHNEIRQDSFHAGHIVSVKNGGDTTLDNLKPICQTCNSSMKTKNMDDFIDNTFKGSKESTSTIKTKSVPKSSPEIKMRKFVKGKNDDEINKWMIDNKTQMVGYPVGWTACPCGKALGNATMEIERRLKDENKLCKSLSIQAKLNLLQRELIKEHLIHYFQ
uniref:HNH domain-containing protein n=1 Tax=viral metagenome TaxID=1070528 RepID=A0A6C0LLI4_9ZZZZ